MLRVLPPSMLAVVMTKLKAQRVLETQVVIQKGRIGTEMFIVTAGLLRVWYEAYPHAPFMLGEDQLERSAPMLPGTVPDEPGRHSAANGKSTPDGGGLLGRGDAFGDYTLTETGNGRIHPYTVTSVVNSLLLALSRKSYVEMLTYFPELPSELKHAVADRNADGQISEQELRSVLPQTLKDGEVVELIEKYGHVVAADDDESAAGRARHRSLSYAQFDQLLEDSSMKPHHRPATLISPTGRIDSVEHPSSGLLRRSHSTMGAGALALENSTLESELKQQLAAIVDCKQMVDELKAKLGI